MPAPAPFRGPRLDTDQAPHVVIPWLVRLRWVSVLALAAAAWAAHDYLARAPAGARAHRAGRACRNQCGARLPAPVTGASPDGSRCRAARRRGPADRHPLSGWRPDQPLQHRLSRRHHGRRGRPGLSMGHRARDRLERRVWLHLLPSPPAGVRRPLDQRCRADLAPLRHVGRVWRRDRTDRVLCRTGIGGAGRT